MTKKKLKFQVDFELTVLNSVPYANGIVFAKLKLPGGDFSAKSDRRPIENNTVAWKQSFSFVAKMTASAAGVLNPCALHISVRKESQGGKSYVKLGVADINLAEFAGAGRCERRYLLQATQSNCILQVAALLSLIAGDPCFKAPTRTDEEAGAADAAPYTMDPVSAQLFGLEAEAHNSSVGSPEAASLLRRGLAQSRVDAQDVIDDILSDSAAKGSDGSLGDAAGVRDSLQLFVAKDGTASIRNSTASM
eukprot:m.27386 g.27386  ORF g.27386 m.27386 type:complete len:249 (-) comp4753_c0_seq1:312-1058(-)